MGDALIWGVKPEYVLREVLTGKRLTIATAESCTGGLIGARITDVPGSSAYFLGGVVAYSNEAKMNILGVRRETIEKHGAVSAECAEEMVRGVRCLFNSDIGVATTGIAGPGGGTPVKPVGLVYMAIAVRDEVRVFRDVFDGDRWQVRERTTVTALKRVLEMLGYDGE